MAATMRNWIAPMAEDEFWTAYQAFRPQYTPGQHLDEFPYICSKEGLSVHLTKGKRVQVIEVLSHALDSNEFDVLLSDASTKLRATFAPTSTAIFLSIHEVEQNMLGALLVLQDYYLSYNPNSPPLGKIALRVTNFKIWGCLGEKTFGKPVGIEQQERLWNVLSKVDELLHDNTPESDDDLEIQSQGGDIYQSESSPRVMTSQVGFATQVPIQAGAARIPPVSNGSDLLAILNAPKLASKGGVKPQAALQPISDSRKAEISSQLESKANSQSSMPSGGSKDIEPLPILPNALPDDDSEKENSQESLNKRKAVVATALSTESQSIVNFELVESYPSFLLPPERNPFEGMKRVPRSYVRIPKNQQALLEQKDSWHKSDSGGRSSYANIPADVLRDLQTHADRVQQGSEPKTPHGIESEVAEKRDSADEESDAGEDVDADVNARGKREGPEEPVHLPEERRLSSDEDSEHSWSESEYGDTESDHAATALSQPLDKIQVEAPEGYGSTGEVHEDQHSERNFSSAPSPVTQKASPRKVKSKIDYNFPASSLGEEEDLELAVPYAIDDEVMVDDGEMAEGPETSQELPSTAVQNKPVVQVEQTPDHYTRKVQEQWNGKQPDSVLHLQYLRGLKNASDDISSDPIIPATFHEASSQDHSTKKCLPSKSDKTTHSTSNNAAEKLYISHEKPDAIDGGDSDEEGEMVEDQLFAEFKSSQHRRRQVVGSLLVRHSSPQLDKHKSPTPDKSRSLNMSRVASPSLRSPPQTSSSSFHTAMSELRSEEDKPARARTSTAKIDLTEPRKEVRDQKPNPRLALQFPVALASQGEVEKVNIEALARANRRKFYAGWSSPTEEAPVVQIAQSQPKSQKSEQLSTSQQFADESSPQSPSGCVQSSVLERPEGGADVQLLMDELASTAKLSRERSLSQDVDGPCSVETPPKLSFSTSLEDASNRIKARAVSLGSESSSPKVLGSSAKAPNIEADVVSVSSDSDSDSEEYFLDIEEGVDKNGMRDQPALANEIYQQHAYDGETSRDYYDSTEPNKEISTGGEESASGEERVQYLDHLSEDYATNMTKGFPQRSEPHELTAFERFKSVYPSYGGREKDFIWALVYIEWLGESKGDDFLRASLWDDFIRTLSAEFSEYIREVKKSQLPRHKTKTGFAYFNMLDKAPIFQNRLITPDNLQDCLLSLNAQQVLETRSKFSPSSSSLAEPPRPESSHGTPSIDSKSQAYQSKGKSATNAPRDVAGPSKPNIIPKDMPQYNPRSATLKRPFFETPSQRQAAKRSRTLGSPNMQSVDVETTSSSTKRRSLPWAYPSSPASMTKARPVTSAPTSSSRTHATTTKLARVQPKYLFWNPRSAQASPSTSSSQDRAPTSKSRDARKAKSSHSFNGSPASPFLGEPEPASRFFSGIDIRSASIGSSRASKLKTPDGSLRRTPLPQNPSSRSQEKGKVEGWLDQNPSPTNAHQPLRSSSIKRKRDGGLQLLESPAPASGSGTKCQKTAPAPTPVASKASTGVRKVPSFRDFLKKRRESGLASSVGSAKSTTKKKDALVEPETQAWSG